MELVEKHKKVIKHDRDKIAIVRDAALLLGCDEEIVGYLQGKINIQNGKLDKLLMEETV